MGVKRLRLTFTITCTPHPILPPQEGKGSPIFFVARVVAFCLIASIWCSSHATAQNYPSHSLRLIVPLAPGGGNDGAARIIGHKLGEALGEQVIVDNRPGGGSIIASELMMTSPPDGHTL